MNECAMCDDGTDYARVKLPFGYTGAMANATEEDSFAGIVEVPLCEKCKEISVRMVTDHETSPLPEWDMSNCLFDNPHTESVGQLLQEAVMLVQSADEDYVMDSRAESAKILTFEAARRGDIQEVP